MSVNKVILVGNVGKDPEVKYFDSGVSVAKFSLATSETYKNKNNEKVTNTEWHNIVLWRKGLPEFAEKYIKKGTPLYIEGRIKSRSYDDKDGNKRYITEIYGDIVQLLGRKGDTSSSDTVPSNEAPDSTNETFEDILPGNNDIADDLPF